MPRARALQPVDESWQRALAVVAHPDDLEFGAAAAVARWTDQDVTATFGRGLASLRAHEAYLRGLGNGTLDAEEFLESLLRPAGARLGATYGASLEVFALRSW